MDHDRFDGLTRSFGAASRRSFTRALTGGGLAAVVGSAFGTLDVDAKKKGRKKKKKQRPVVNRFGCLDVDQPCQGNGSLCCSGVCAGTAPKKGKPDQSRCVAHNNGICTASADFCTTGVPATCNSQKLSSCTCARTTGNAGFCGDFSAGGDKLCRVCTRDTDCQAEFGPGAACVVAGGICTDICAATGGTMCVPACV